MFTNRARILVTGAFIVLLGFALQWRVYELVGVIVMFIGLLVYGYFKEGTVIMAAKAFHKKDYDRAESLLSQISRPQWLSKQRRGFYEFIMGGINLQKQDFAEAERHYELAAQYPLRSANDHVAALVHVANINIRFGNFEKAKAYLQLTDQHEAKTTAKMKEVIVKLHQELEGR
jgi:tetratricopeptide (TPR) repeat protein